MLTAKYNIFVGNIDEKKKEEENRKRKKQRKKATKRRRKWYQKMSASRQSKERILYCQRERERERG